MDRQTLGNLSLAAGVVSVLFLLASLATAGSPVGPPVFLYPAFVLAIAAIALGVSVIRDEATAQAGVALGHGVAVAGLVLGLVYATAVVVIPILLLILLLVFGWPWYYGYTGGCGAQGSTSSPRPCCECPPCGSCSCGDCGCGSCGCGDCGCGSCGGCGNCGCGGCGGCGGGCGGCGGGGGCGCAAPFVGFGALLASGGLAQLLDRMLAHHPDLPEYRADVYRVAGVRVCVGCFTTFPVFLLATAALLVLPPLAWGWAMMLGLALAATQAISSAGFARWRWTKMLVKSALGTGLALVVVGTRAAPIAPLAKVAILLAALGLALASGIPRARRMRRAAVARGCACQQSPTLSSR